MKLHLPWKKLGKALRTLLGITAQVTDNPFVDKAEEFVEDLERRMPDEPGAHKAEAFDGAMVAVIESELVGLPQALKEQAQALVSEYRDNYVAVRNVKERFEASFDKLQAFWRTVKALKSAPDAPVE